MGVPSVKFERALDDAYEALTRAADYAEAQLEGGGWLVATAEEIATLRAAAILVAVVQAAHGGPMD